MSLILDALKKSEAERQRGQPPTLHAHFSAPRRNPRRLPWAAGAGAVLLAAGLAGSGLWLARGRSGDVVDAAGSPIASAGSPATTEPARGAADAAPLAAPPPASNPVEAPATQALADATQVATQSPPIQEAVLGGVAGAGDGGTVSGGGLPVPERAMLYTPSAMPGAETAANPPAPTLPSPPSPAVASAPATIEPPPAAMPPPEPSPAVHVVDHGPSGPSAAEAAPVSKPEEVLPEMFQLPYATRKDMPKLELSMHVFSPDPMERFIVLNGKRYTLATPAPGPELTLLDIVADGAVFEFRGQRFLLPRQAY